MHAPTAFDQRARTAHAPSLTQRIFEPLMRRCARSQASLLAPWIPGGSSVLDFGCGDAMVSATLARSLPIAVTALDVLDYRLDESAPFVLHDGGTLPFPDASFDVVVAAFVLHHTQDPFFHLAEIARVARSRVLLLEDTYRNRVERILTSVLDHVGNWLQSTDIDIPCNVRSEREWASHFALAGLAVEYEARFINHPQSHLVPRHAFHVLRPTRR